MPLSFFIHTVGCQMNVLDSELVTAELSRPATARPIARYGPTSSC